MAEPDEVRPDDERQEFLEHRASGIGATDSPKILGLSRWGTSLSVYNDKVAGEDRKMSLPAWLGLKMQDTVGELYATATGTRLRAANKHYRHKRYDWMVCHLDFRAWGKPKLLVECKTRAYMNGWGEDGTAEIPVDVWVQVQHEMAVMEAEETHVAVLFGHHTFRVYVIKRDEAFITKLITTLEEWWVRHYLARVPPMPSGHEIDTAAMRARYPESDEALIGATAEHEVLAEKLRLAVLNAAQADVALEELKNRFREIIGPAAGIAGASWSITNKKSKAGTSVDWEMVATTYGNVIEELFLLAHPGDDDREVQRLARAQSTFDTAVGLATNVKPGSRRFVMTFKEKR